MSRNLLIPMARNWTGKRIPSAFTVTADGTPLAPSGDPPAYDIPPDSTSVVISANPGAAVYWPAEADLSVAADGSLTPIPGSLPLVKLASTDGADLRVTVATIQVSRFKDVTQDVLDLLSKPPSKRVKKGVAGALPVDEIGDETNRFGAFPPPDWDLHSVPDAQYLDVVDPVDKDDGTLNFAKDPALAVNADSVVLRLAGVDAPQLFAVVWPRAIAPRENADPTPIFVYIRQTAGQNVDAGLFQGPELGPYPDNFDYAFFGLFLDLHYGVDSPLDNFGPKGVPYQVAKSGTKAVTVTVCNRVGKEFGVLKDAEEMGRILLEMQAFMFMSSGIQTPPASLGKTAIGAFSSGNYFLDNFLKNPTNRSGHFLTDIVTAVYWLDPPTAEINGFIGSARTWAAGATDKRIRLYSRKSVAAHQKLLGSAPPPEPFVLDSVDKKNSAAAVDEDDVKKIQTERSWTKTFTKVLGRVPGRTLDWLDAHHTIAATMLTHALSHGDI